ncbi:hypothetical protein [Poseidonocella sp. HB161398]|uniref:hypothetical protein n=1 Tax=Poseidonocella sp. HB161398 TaxID=2320855 RepID=UPI0011098BDC|nr:hypothetical protein [Poseidonocella sp. HB161398]
MLLKKSLLRCGKSFDSLNYEVMGGLSEASNRRPQHELNGLLTALRRRNGRSPECNGLAQQRRAPKSAISADFFNNIRPLRPMLQGARTPKVGLSPALRRRGKLALAPMVHRTPPSRAEERNLPVAPVASSAPWQPFADGRGGVGRERLEATGKGKRICGAAAELGR